MLVTLGLAAALAAEPVTEVPAADPVETRETTAPAPDTTAEPQSPARRGLRGGPARLTINTLVSGAAIGAGVAATYNHVQARHAYDDFLAFPDDTIADNLYATEVRPRARLATGEAIGAGLLAAAGATLWITTEF